MFQESEIIALVVALVAAFLLFFLFARREIPKLGFFYAGFFCIVAASLFTVVEGVLWNDFFNVLEHACYLFSGLFFLLGCRALLDPGPEEGGRRPRGRCVHEHGGARAGPEPVGRVHALERL